ncbi:MAG: PD-(D/E)XK nuclease family transposase [Lachnospiraceae bacterium]|nr:PD-(D/E)XK nuclease family transposase [Lachnospiraceae bacterium]
MSDLDEKLSRIRKFRPIDDIFFEVMAKDKLFDQEMLRVILGDANLIVEDVIVQSDERNLYGRSVRLDALCTLSDGTRCNIEVQRSNNDNHLKRVRYNASMITTRESEPGGHYENIPDVYVVYISEFDLFKQGKTIYHIEKIITETGEMIDDGIHEIFVNTAVNDGTEIAEYMSFFMSTEVNSTKFPAITSRMNQLKNTEGGLNSMCKIMEDYLKERTAEKDELIAKKDNQLAEKDELIAEKDEEIESLKKQLAATQKSN